MAVSRRARSGFGRGASRCAGGRNDGRGHRGGFHSGSFHRRSSGDERRDFCRQFAAAFLAKFLQLVRSVGVPGIDRQDLPQAVFFFGVVYGHGAEPQPGVFIARIGDEREIEHLAGLLVLAAPRQRNALSKQVFGVHRQVIGTITVIVCARLEKSTGGLGYGWRAPTEEIASVLEWSSVC